MEPLAEGHEDVVLHQDRDSGLRAIVAVYDTRLGPGLGGTRMLPYPSEEAALADVLGLSKAMAYKNALAGLAHGGAKAVIVGDPDRDKSPALLRAYGELVQSLDGRYVTACDVGTYVADMDVIAETSDYVTGRSEARGGAGDSGVLTAFGVFQGIRACAQHRWGSPELIDRRVGVAGIGKVGARLVTHLLEAGAQVIASDVRPEPLQRLADAHGRRVGLEQDPDRLLSTELDVYSPNALGGVLSPSTVATLAAQVVCGGANTQLAGEGTDLLLAERGILYAPDYLVNAGGVIQVAEELHGFDMQRARAKVEGIFDTTLAVLSRATAAGITPRQAADAIAEERMATGTWRWRARRNRPGPGNVVPTTQNDD